MILRAARSRESRSASNTLCAARLNHFTPMLRAGARADILTESIFDNTTLACWS
jgi:hypothetical protein